jgi:hypothetical protein
METYNRICIKDFTVTGEDGKTFTLKKGNEYLTSGVGRAPTIMQFEPLAGHVVVFERYWVRAPVEIFEGGKT